MTAPQVYWLDANVLIAAKDGPYQFAVAPSFWSEIEKQVDQGRIRVPKMVYEEIVRDGAKDQLANWLKLRKSDGFCVSPSRAVQEAFKVVANHVYEKYKAPFASDFLKVADPWVIAHALESRGVVVTFEVKSLGTGRVKIPNVCADLSVPRLDLYRMIPRLAIRLSNS